jgi:hypothetical protein
LFSVLLVFSGIKSWSQAVPDTTKPFVPIDTLAKNAAPVSDKSRIDSVMKNHSPKKAAIRSAILPGLGQIYNKKYWKLPIIYGALGISGAVFVYNIKNYRDLRFAYTARIEAQPTIDPVTGQTIPGDSTKYYQIKPNLLVFDMGALRTYRDEFRRNVDYSVLAFLLLWGLNVVDATVDAHLKAFDVSPDLSLKFKLGPSQMAGTNGVSFILALK